MSSDDDYDENAPAPPDDNDYDDEDDYSSSENGYEIGNDFDEDENLPSYPIDNMQFDVHEKDTLEGWVHENRDSGSSTGPFMTQSSTIIDLTNPTPEHFFNQLFDNRMWTIIAELQMIMHIPNFKHLKVR